MTDAQVSLTELVSLFTLPTVPAKVTSLSLSVVFMLPIPAPPSPPPAIGVPVGVQLLPYFRR